MKWNRILCVVGFTLSTTAFAQVVVNLTVNEPTSGGTFTSPVLASAFESSPNPTGFDVYLDSTLVLHDLTTSGILNTTFAWPAGTHTVVITAWDNSGAYTTSDPESITVIDSPFPTVPGGATVYPNLQLQAVSPVYPATYWLDCTTNACSGSEVGSTCSTTTPGYIAPGPPPTAGFGNYNNSLSGASMSENITGTYCNLLQYRHLLCPTAGCPGVGHALEDMWFETTATSQMEASEFDPDMYDGAALYQLSTQCRLLGTDAGYWYLWDMADEVWWESPYPCTATTIAPGSFHHYQLYGTFYTVAEGQTQTYETFVFDGQVVFQNLGKSFDALPTVGPSAITVQAQIDNSGATNATNTNYYDNYTLTVW